MTDIPSAPGVYEGVNFDTYVQIKAKNSTTLKEVDRSPLHAKYLMTHPKAPTPAMVRGDAKHTALLEPDKFEERYVRIYDGVNRRSNVGKEKWAAFEEAAKASGRQILTQEDYDNCLTMRDGWLADPEVRGLLAAPRASELTIIWDCPVTDVRMKARLDILAQYWGTGVIVDVKSCANASLHAFRNQAWRLKYHLQLAMYGDGLDALFPKSKRLRLILAIEQDPPYATAIYEPTETWLEHGRNAYQHAAKTLAECERTNIWPSYATGRQLLDPPAWASTSDWELL